MKRYVRSSEDGPYFIEKNNETSYSIVRKDDLSVVSTSHESYADALAELKRILAKERETTTNELEDNSRYVVYAKGLRSKDNGFYWCRRGGGAWRTEAEADTFTRAEADKLEQMRGKYTWVKQKVNASVGHFTGDPDPSGMLEGDIRFLNPLHSWTDVYRKFVNIADKYYPDTDRIDEEIAKFYEHYYKYNNVPEWKYFQDAYERWIAPIDDDPIEHEPSWITASTSRMKPSLEEWCKDLSPRIHTLYIMK